MIEIDRTIQVRIDEGTLNLDDRIELSTFLADLTPAEISRLSEYRG